MLTDLNKNFSADTKIIEIQKKLMASGIKVRWVRSNTPKSENKDNLNLGKK